MSQKFWGRKEREGGKKRSEERERERRREDLGSEEIEREDLRERKQGGKQQGR